MADFPNYTYDLNNPGSSVSMPSTGNWFSSLSPQMQAALLGSGASLAGGYIQGREQKNLNNANNDASMQRLELQLQLQREQSQREMEQRQKELGLQAATQAPVRQDWRQHQALMAAMLPGVRNAQVTPPGDLGRFTPQISGGMRIPEGGFNQETLNYFSPQARVSAESDLDKQAAIASGGNYHTPDYANVGYGPQAAGVGADTQSYADKLKQQALQSTAQLGSASPTTAGRQTQTNVGANKQGPGMGSKLGHAALMAGLGYLASRYGGSQNGQKTNPWLSAGLAGAGAFI